MLLLEGESLIFEGEVYAGAGRPGIRRSANSE